MKSFSFIRCCVPMILFSMTLPRLHAGEDVKTLTVMHWNVENLFDSDDDLNNPGDDEYLPHTFKLWTPERYQRKLEHLAEMLIPLNADFITVSEIENRRVLEDLAKLMKDRAGLEYPHIIHQEGPDKRGIDVAIISKYPATRTNFVATLPGQRDSLFADFTIGGAALTLSVNHWKSHKGNAHETLDIRMQQARIVRAEVDRRLSETPEAALVVLGDFNDNYEAATLIMGLRSITDLDTVLQERSQNYLYNLHDSLRRGSDGTYYNWYGFNWNTFDSISVSAGMLADAKKLPSGWQVVPKSYRVYKPEKAKGEHGRPKSFVRLRDPDTRELVYQEGYSDHYPVVVTLLRR